jgi:hypothetical protein
MATAAPQAPSEPTAGGRRRPHPRAGVVATLVLVGCVVAGGLLLIGANRGRTSTSGLDEQAAVQTVRSFVSAAVVTNNGQEACGLLTAAEQARVAAAGGPGSTCSQVIANRAAQAPDRVATTGLVGGLADAVVVRPGAAAVRLGEGPSTARFALVPAPDRSSWRIAAGAAAMVVR